jgi:hypothetical protein
LDHRSYFWAGYRSPRSRERDELRPRRRLGAYLVIGTVVLFPAHAATALSATLLVTTSGDEMTPGDGLFRFTGRLAGRKLKPGAYRLKATPKANGMSGKSASAGFRVIR